VGPEMQKGIVDEVAAVGKKNTCTATKPTKPDLLCVAV